MDNRLSIILTTRRVSISITINKLINFLQKLPVIGKGFPDSLYGSLDGKIFVFIIASVIRFIRRLTLKGLYIGLMVVLGSLIVLETGLAESTVFSIDAAMTIFFFLSFLGAPLAFGKAINLDVGTDLMMIDKLRADAAAYVPARIYERKIIDFGFNIPFAILLSFSDQYSLWQALAILPILTGVKIIFESLLLLNYSFFRKFSKSAYKTVSYIYVVLGLLAMFTPYLLLFLDIYFPFKAVVFNPVFIIGTVVLTFFSVKYINSYKNYRELAWGTVVNYNLALEKAKPAQQKQLFGNSDKWNKDVDGESLQAGKFDHLQGYAFFNKLFFYRHRNFFRKKIMIRVAICVIAVVVLTGILVLGSDSATDVSEESGGGIILPTCFFFAYMLSMGRTATSAMFANCDVAMLSYSFYRTPVVVIKNFYYRLKKIMLYNAPTFALLGLFAISGDILAPLYKNLRTPGDSATLNQLVNLINWSDLPLYVITVTMMWLFFSFHDLFIYYIIQPYTSEFGTKSKLFSIIQFVVYLVSYANIMLSKIDLTIYMLIITAATLLYVTIGLISINKFCWRTFKLK